MNFQRGAYSSVAPPSSGSRSGGQTHPRFAPPSSSSSSSSARPQARNIRKPIKGGYFDDDDDDGDDDSGAGGGFPNTVPSNPASGAAAEDDYDPLDAFMAGVEEQVKHDEANIGKTEALPEIVSGIDDGELEYYESNRAQVSNEDSDDENVADIYDDEGNVIKKEKTRVEPLPPVDHSKIQYHSFRKCFYREHRDITSMSDADVQSLRDDFELSVQGGDVPRPIKKFEQSGLHYNLLKEIERLGFEAPTAIQAQALPIALSGRDIIGLAKTGSGKTFSFLWPMLMHVLDQPRMRSGDGPIGLVLSPTRELAAQIHTEAQKFAKIYGITVCPIYGGAGKWEMTKALKESPEIVIATPGRLIELIRSKATNLERCTMVVLDEADRMFEMGFEYQMRSIVNNIRPTRQTLLFSATMKRKVEGFAREILSEPIRIVIGSIGQANPDIKQHVEVFSSDTQKWAWLSGQADDFVADGKVLIFVGQKATAEDLAIQLKMHFRRRQLDIGVDCLHGDKDQSERNSVMKRFARSSKMMENSDSSDNSPISILVATDIASRGLDIKDIRTVVNYEAAKNIETHVHRIGRTGRMGIDGVVPGTAYTLLSLQPGSSGFAVDLCLNLKASGQDVPGKLLHMAENDPRWGKVKHQYYGAQGGGWGNKMGGGAGKNRGGHGRGPGIGFGAKAMTSEMMAQESGGNSVQLSFGSRFVKQGSENGNNSHTPISHAGGEGVPPAAGTMAANPYMEGRALGRGKHLTQPAWAGEGAEPVLGLPAGTSSGNTSLATSTVPQPSSTQFSDVRDADGRPQGEASKKRSRFSSTPDPQSPPIQPGMDDPQQSAFSERTGSARMVGNDDGQKKTPVMAGFVRASSASIGGNSNGHTDGVPKNAEGGNSGLPPQPRKKSRWG